MTSDLPWDKIIPPRVDRSYSALRVTPDGQFDFFWGLDSASRPLLILKYLADDSLIKSVPKLREIEVHRAQGESGFELLIWALRERTHRALFHELCRDIVSATSECRNTAEAVRASLGRTMQWQRLMRGESRLSRESQMGLIGELLFLEEVLIEKLGVAPAIEAWVGPFKATKDFDLGWLKVECKTRSEGSTKEVRISSESQLEATTNLSLILNVTDVVSVIGRSGGFSLTDLAMRVRSRIEKSEPHCLQGFDERLRQVGLFLEDDYSDFMWVASGHSHYNVLGAFPRLVASEMPIAVSKVQYSIDLAQCDSYLISRQALIELLGGEND